jgi:hypothetical protein
MPRQYEHSPHLHRLRRAFIVARCQANYRNEGWELTWDDWQYLWLTKDRYLRKGRGADDLGLSRLDYSSSWCMDNVQIETRKDHLSRIVSQKSLKRQPKQKTF